MSGRSISMMMLSMMMGIKAGDGVGYADGQGDDDGMAIGWSCSCSP